MHCDQYDTLDPDYKDFYGSWDHAVLWEGPLGEHGVFERLQLGFGVWVWLRTKEWFRLGEESEFQQRHHE